jgi:hypothetical protein
MCCGKKRAKAGQPLPANPTANVEQKITQPPQPEGDPLVYFQYLGASQLTVIGPTSHKRYRFNNPGAIVAVDPLDKRALAGVSILKQVRNVAEEPTRL